MSNPGKIPPVSSLISVFFFFKEEQGSHFEIVPDAFEDISNLLKGRAGRPPLFVCGDEHLEKYWVIDDGTRDGKNVKKVKAGERVKGFKYRGMTSGSSGRGFQILANPWLPIGQITSWRANIRDEVTSGFT
jgi:hypothetical protein